MISSFGNLYFPVLSKSANIVTIELKKCPQKDIFWIQAH